MSDILLELAELTEPDVELEMLAELAERRILEAGATPVFKGYKPDWAQTPFPTALCTSVENEVCHGIPRHRTLKAGTIVKYDLGLKLRTGCADAAITVNVGEIDNRRQRLMRYGLEALYEGIKVIKPGVSISDIGKAIEKNCATHGYSIMKGFGGHHIGKEVHLEPNIPNFYDSKYNNIFLKEGSVICLEPMISPGKDQVQIWKEDKWTAFIPSQPVVHFEHMILVTKDGYEILTTWDN